MSFEPNEQVEGPNFIWIKTKTPSEVTSILLDRFPGVRELAESFDELTLVEPFHAYDLFGADICNRVSDHEFLQCAGLFISELAESRDPLIGDVLVTGLLEKIAEDPNAVDAISKYVSPKVRELLRDVEEQFYRRFR
jgi:hypothetical protein